MTDLPILVAALYQFTVFDDPADVRERLAGVCEAQGIKGTLLVAGEGLNGTIAGSDAGIAAALAEIRGLPGCAGIAVKFSRAAEMPFGKMKVRLKREIVTMGQPGIDPLSDVGHYVAPADWNALIAQPETILIDTRNDYEVALGTFEGAINPQTRTFRDFPDWFRKFRAEHDGPMPPVAMFCTGGIRCEKATAFLKAEGLEQVYHLEGGILAYLEQVPAAESRWQGECFVFDERVTVTGEMLPGGKTLCPRCQVAMVDGVCAECAEPSSE